jgi:uncharacterized protein
MILVRDDLRARRIATDMGLRLTGTVGLLLRTKRDWLLDSVGRALGVIDEVGFRLSAELHEEALRLAGEACDLR